MAELSALSRYDLLDLTYVIAQLTIALGILGWMFFNLPRVIAENGSLDLYLNFVDRSLGWQIAVGFVYFVLWAVI